MKARVTERDAGAVHQIDLRRANHSGWTTIYCNCRKKPLGEMLPDGNPWVIFNDVRNHDESMGRFVPAKKTWKVYEVE